MVHLTATNLIELAQISSEIHDFWFQLSNMVAQTGTTRQIGLFENVGLLSSKFRYSERQLLINDIEDMKVIDTQEIDMYDVNSLVYSSSGTLTLKTNIPLILEFSVSKLNVELIVGKAV